MKTWAFAVPLSGPARRLDYGPAGDVAVCDGAVLVGSAMNFEPAEPAQWKRYRGGAGGKIWMLGSLDAEPVRTRKRPERPDGEPSRPLTIRDRREPLPSAAR